MVIGGRDRMVHAIDEADRRAALDVHDPRAGRFVARPPRDGRVYIGSGDGRFYVLDLATGEKLWEFDTGAPLVRLSRHRRGQGRDRVAGRRALLLRVKRANRWSRALGSTACPRVHETGAGSWARRTWFGIVRSLMSDSGHPLRHPAVRHDRRPRLAATSSPTIPRSRSGRQEAVDDRPPSRRSASPSGRRATRAVPPHPVLPEALPLLLLPRVHRQERQRGARRILDVLAREWELYDPARDRRPAARLRLLRGRHAVVPLRAAAPPVSSTALSRRQPPGPTASEITFECEPGTLTEPKLAAIRDMGVTRLSLGVEHFDDQRARAEWPRASVGRDLPCLRLRPVDRFSADQHRPDRRHAGRERTRSGATR